MVCKFHFLTELGGYRYDVTMTHYDIILTFFLHL